MTERSPIQLSYIASEVSQDRTTVDSPVPETDTLTPESLLRDELRSLFRTFFPDDSQFMGEEEIHSSSAAASGRGLDSSTTYLVTYSTLEEGENYPTTVTVSASATNQPGCDFAIARSSKSGWLEIGPTGVNQVSIRRSQRERRKVFGGKPQPLPTLRQPASPEEIAENIQLLQQIDERTDTISVTKSPGLHLI